MNENEKKAFRMVYEFYAKWREQVIETEEQWTAFAGAVGALGAILDIDNNPLGWHLMNAVLETFNDLYRGGKKPLPAGYFGRDDLLT